MTIKEYLSQAYYINLRIKYKLDELKSLRELYTKVNSVFSDLPRNKNAHQQMETNIIRIIDLEWEIDCEVQRLINIKSDISELIKRAEIDEHRLILELRYLHLKKWGEIAHIMGYGVDNVYKIHRRALKNLKFPESLQ